MEGNNNLSHNVPTWSSTKLITFQTPAASFSLEPNEKILKDSTQECRSPNRAPIDDKGDNKGKEAKEGHGENIIGMVAHHVEETGRERLKRLREQVMKEKVNIPETWGQEQKLKDWIDYTMFDTFFAPHSLIVTARDALVANAGKSKSPRLRI